MMQVKTESLGMLEWLQLIIGKRLDRVSDGTATDFLIWGDSIKKFIPFTSSPGMVVPYTLSFTYRNGKFEILRVVNNMTIETEGGHDNVK